ncbi:undecaprenyldiphospho-muramoylpentapeptide beta-N-acetylglucosaminyltransferase [Catellatospora bangladeshensis]|uniref:UDP-N-acetylglucosamine--N-acetylmuramyl-(pentapeptide) pyrophosphoryl-undecaprenol N-acetylglucosamine transferase n=1 Tax=Catellatospora bangladeshensis TaxID=310355 RepID=A0A8J3JE80_9ACTN|nr:MULTISPECIES: undecaprenyldiphospho-muramoylpentapeptide beta-N-acetylglucosaminyltransferase [Catellatospora]BCJ77817.1 UDP-N-acetylglucosamine--N-acetylmuramyl-(pentapeptide) pyrophosphoryl-undecaprenol N-acetylglucosamine transferase [Catellatospora sp. IY07-71]GIF79036.1 UDP-N-acetylglucosamine--N-acetylmuramyl-(pentapeptide) pyrophosphoryl-undecaprenol N-acetylglucosamine transferase [Catellatospora bangladeshensis]
MVQGDGRLRSVVLAGGGTGGHIYPLLAFADCLRRHDPDIRITCLGTPRGLETELIPAAGYDLRHVPAFQLPRSVNMNLLRTPDRMYRSTKAARAIMDEVQADAVVGFGGYVSVPAYLAAWRRHTPIVIHEVNVPAGIANKLGMKFTDNVAVGFPHQPRQDEALRDATVVGVPLRQSLATVDRVALREQARAHFGLDPHRPTLFVFGASQGARSINLAVAASAKALTSAGVQVLHVIGARNEDFDVPSGLDAPYVRVKFINEMQLGYAAADLALCRGGAITCAETAALGVPAIYVPLPYGNGEQRRNALPVVEAGGGLIVDDAELTPQWIEQNVLPLVTDSSRLATMGYAAAAYGRRDGDEQLRSFLLNALASAKRN